MGRFREWRLPHTALAMPASVQNLGFEALGGESNTDVAPKKLKSVTVVVEEKNNNNKPNKAAAASFLSKFPWTVLLLKATLYYSDFVSDVLYAMLLRESDDLVGLSNCLSQDTQYTHRRVINTVRCCCPLWCMLY